MIAKAEIIHIGINLTQKAKKARKPKAMEITNWTVISLWFWL